MDSYDPSKTPNKDLWLGLDEQERIALVRDYHSAIDDDSEESMKPFHSILHAIVENQIAEEVEPVPATMDKLQRQGLSRHEALHAVGAVLSEGLFKTMQGDKEEFENTQYRRRLDKLTAKRWRKGQY